MQKIGVLHAFVIMGGLAESKNLNDDTDLHQFPITQAIALMACTLFHLQVAKDGGCLFHAIRRHMNCPKEYTSIHLRRQVIAHVCSHIEFYAQWELFVSTIMGQSGVGGRGMSIYSYLKSQFNPDTWGDEICLSIVSHMWGITATICRPQLQFHEDPIRHNLTMAEADMAFLLTAGNHYSPIGKSSAP